MKKITPSLDATPEVKDKRNKEKVITNALCDNLEKLAFSSISFQKHF